MQQLVFYNKCEIYSDSTNRPKSKKSHSKFGLIIKKSCSGFYSFLIIGRAVDIINYLSDMGWEYVDKQVAYEFLLQQIPTHDYYYTFRKLKQQQ